MLGGNGRLHGLALLELAKQPLVVAPELLLLPPQRDPLPDHLLRLLLQQEHRVVNSPR